MKLFLDRRAALIRAATFSAALAATLGLHADAHAQAPANPTELRIGFQSRE